MLEVFLNMEEQNTDFKEKYQLRYLIMPDFVYQDKRLNDVSRRLLAFIITYKTEKFFFSNEHLAKMFNSSIVNISRAVNQLKKLGYIDVFYEIKSGGGKIRYVRLIKNDMSDLSKMISQTYQKSAYNDNKIKDNKKKENKINGILNLIEVPKIDTSNSKGEKEKTSIPKDWQLEVIEEFKKWYKVKFKEDYLVKKEDYINVANLLKVVPKDQLLANVKKFIACDHHIPRRYGYTIGVFYKYYSNLVSTKFGIYA